MKVITGRVIGGIIALAGGAMVLLECLLNTSAISTGGNSLDKWIVNLIIGLWAIIGGIMGILKSRIGGGLALLAGIFAILCQILWYLNQTIATYFHQFSLLETFGLIIPYVTLEGILMVLGGIITFASKE
jgi:hypothetical protein